MSSKLSEGSLSTQIFFWAKEFRISEMKKENINKKKQCICR